MPFPRRRHAAASCSRLPRPHAEAERYAAVIFQRSTRDAASLTIPILAFTTAAFS